MKFHVVQHIYYLFLCCFTGFYFSLGHLGCVVDGHYFTPMAPELYYYRMVDLVTGIIFYLRLIVIPVYLTGSLFTLLQVSIFNCIAEDVICQLQTTFLKKWINI
jgi:hypothetical protein